MSRVNTETNLIQAMKFDGTATSKSNCIRLENYIRPRRCIRHGQTDTTSEMRVQFRRRSSDASNEMHKLF